MHPLLSPALALLLAAPAPDWLVEDIDAPATVRADEEAHELVLDNALLRRTLRTAPGLATRPQAMSAPTSAPAPIRAARPLPRSSSQGPAEVATPVEVAPPRFQAPAPSPETLLRAQDEYVLMDDVGHERVRVAVGP